MKQQESNNHHPFKGVLLCTLLLFLPLIIFGQELNIKGKVTDVATNEPLPGVTIIEKGTTNGTTTNNDGIYSIKVSSANCTLIFSYLGYKTEEIALQGQTKFDLGLVPDITKLNEVVVLGYSTIKKKDLTGSVSVVDMNKVGNSNYSNAIQAVQGQTSGVNITEDGQPGSGRTSITIRGLTSLNSNSPLYVIDGIAVTDGLNNLNPNDIESFQILKDAASASIYGSRSAGGVIIITTKKGKSGKLNIDAGYQRGVQTLSHKIDVLNAPEWGQVYWQASKNDGTTPNLPYMYGNGATPIISTQPFIIPNGKQIYQYTTNGTDWYKAVYHNAASTQEYINLSNGNEKGSCFLGLSYFSQDGLIKYTYYNRYTARVNSDYKIVKWIKVGENLSLSNSNEVQIGTQQSQDGIPTDVLRQHPLLPVYDAKGNFAGKISAFPDVRNMVSVLEKNKDNKNTANELFGNFYLEANFFEPFESLKKSHSLIFRSKYGVEYSDYYNRQFQAAYQEGDYDIETNVLTNNYGKGLTTTLDNTLEYNYNHGNHSFKLLGGSETIKYDYTFLSGTRTGFEIEDPAFTYLNAGAGVQTNGGGGTSWGLSSYFGRMDYSFADRYLVSTTLRYDKTSRFSSAGTFPAISLGWRLTEEPFIKSFLDKISATKILSDVKLRAGYGEQGNQNSYDFATRSLIGADVNHADYDITGSNTSVTQGYVVIQRGNPELKWESTKQYNYGTDISFFNKQVDITFDYFIKNTSDILLPENQISAVGEGAAPYSNAAKLKNNGYEIELNLRNANPIRNFSFNAQFLVSQFWNKVISLPNSSPLDYNGISYIQGQDGSYRTAVGRPMADFYGYVAEGIFQNQQDITNHASQLGAGVGRIKYKDINGDGIIDDKDRTFLGSPYPKINLGFNFNVEYKGISLSMIFFSSLGQKIYNYNKWFLDFAQSGNFNHGKDMLNAWSLTNTGSNIPAPTLNNNNNEDRISSYYVEDGSFVKLRTIRLNYRIPSQFTRNFKINLYTEVQNVFTITKYSGIDPEVPYAGGNVNVPGIDRGAYPLPRTFILGARFNF